MPIHNILVVEDEELMRSILRQLIERAGYKVFTADSAEAALEIFASNDIVVVVTDIRMGGKDGLQLLDDLKTIDPNALVVIMTAYSSVDSAVAALRKGAYDYVTKPFVNEDILQTIRNAVLQNELFRENRALRRELERKYDFTEIIGTSDALQKVFDIVKKVATTSANVLIQGESGTGKELVARSIHFNSGRADKPFIAINCGALPEPLLESELFGHTRGSFTGAVAESIGLLRSAGGGTLFLDEIGEMPQPLQVKLLRALQEHEVTPVGSATPMRFDARIIAATNKELEDEVEAGRFREDLFYRLNVIAITLPPLRDRRDDIPLLIKHFLAKAARSENASIKSVSGDAMFALVNYTWPGNVRELENAIQRAVILSSDEIGIDGLPPKIQFESAGSFDARDTETFRPTLDEVERKYVMEILDAAGDDKAKAANVLGIDLSTLYRKLKKYQD